MYDRLPLDYIGITDDFGERIDPISKEKTFHTAIDLGWHKKAGEPIYAANDGTVLLEEFDSTLGNYLVLSYEKDGKTIINRYCHMKDRAIVKKGEKVKRKQIIGYMGTTGYSTGVHLHFEYWIGPKNYKYYYGDRLKYAVDPLKYCYLFEDQIASTNSLPRLKKVVGSPVTKDNAKNQLEVIKIGLNCRTDGSLTSQILGYIDFGYYNILGTKEKDGYNLYKIDNNKWIANTNNCIKLYLLKPTDCSKLEEENMTLKKELEEKDKLIEDLKNKSIDNFNFFTSKKDDNYYIYLKEEETIYY